MNPCPTSFIRNNRADFEKMEVEEEQQVKSKKKRDQGKDIWEHKKNELKNCEDDSREKIKKTKRSEWV